MNDALFTSAHAALTFALNYSSMQYSPPVMNRMAAPVVGTGKGLVGLDGAAQAGMIRLELSLVGKHKAMALIGRVAPRWYPCSCANPCCSGRKINSEWKEAVEILCDHFGSGPKELQVTLMTKYFGGKMTMQEIAADNALHRETVSKHYTKLVKNMKKLESEAWGAIEDKLQNVGIVTSTT